MANFQTPAAEATYTTFDLGSAYGAAAFAALLGVELGALGQFDFVAFERDGKVALAFPIVYGGVG